MTIYQRMQQIFAAADVPGFLQGWQVTEEYPVIPDIFAAYIVNAETPMLCADDVTLIGSTSLSLHVYGKTDVSDAVAKIKAALLADDFMISNQRDLDDVRNGEYIYHRKMDLTFIEFGG